MAGIDGRGFNADAKAAEREGPVTIGGVTYHPRRLTNKRLRQVRATYTAAESEADAAARESQEYRDAYAAAIAEGQAEEQAVKAGEKAGQSAEAVVDINLAALATLLPILLMDDGLQPPSAEVVQRHLDEDLDARDVGGLMAYLLGEEEDPTPQTPEPASATSP